MSGRSFISVLVLVLGFALSSAPNAFAQHEGHNHGEAEKPAGMADIPARAFAVGANFQLVALPKAGQLVIFLDNTETNAPAKDARIEIFAGDALVTAEETAPGLYVVSPWPPEGLSVEDAETVELIATVVSGDREEVLLAHMSGAVEGGHEGHDHGPTAGKSTGAQVALWNGARPFVLPAAAGLIALFGAVTGLRGTGRRRWIGLGVTGVGIVTMIAATGLV
ncbi:hypothetical protein BAL199_24209 [alpha proteobacterium BAL199]|jgi:hypothetical protein|nr:hypothetical protein BAL199_24209 [alpha proteobacterium BAL199]